MEEELKQGRCLVERYERYSQGSFVRGNFDAKDLYDAVKIVVSNLGCYLSLENFAEPTEEDDPDYNFWVPDNATPEYRDEMAHRVIDKLQESNGDGCDFIVSFIFDGEEYIAEEENLYEEQEWTL